MSFWVYVLRCSDGSYYTGHGDNLDVRLAQHRAGQGGGYTRDRLPVELMYSEWFPDRDSSFHAEQRIKNWSRAKKEALFIGDWATVRRMAVPPCEREKRSASLDFARDEWSEGATASARSEPS